MKKWKSEDGYTGVDASIAVIVLFIFVTMIAMLSYRVNSLSKEIELKANATSIAVDEIEKMKNISFSEIENYSEKNGNSKYFPSDANKSMEEIPEKQGYYKQIIIQDYADLKEGKEDGFVKKVTVVIAYKFKNQEERIELSTLITREG